jgi:hypothetical protein
MAGLTARFADTAETEFALPLATSVQEMSYTRLWDASPSMEGVRWKARSLAVPSGQSVPLCTSMARLPADLLAVVRRQRDRATGAAPAAGASRPRVNGTRAE